MSRGDSTTSAVGEPGVKGLGQRQRDRAVVGHDDVDVLVRRYLGLSGAVHDAEEVSPSQAIERHDMDMLRLRRLMR